jgi:hypothetical protein
MKLAQKQQMVSMQAVLPALNQPLPQAVSYFLQVLFSSLPYPVQIFYV